MHVVNLLSKLWDFVESIQYLGLFLPLNRAVKSNTSKRTYSAVIISDNQEIN